jgi:hypothetical protein
MFNCVNLCSNAARFVVGAVVSGGANGIASAITSALGGLVNQSSSSSAVAALAGNAVLLGFTGGVGAVCKAEEQLIKKFTDSSIWAKLGSVAVIAACHTGAAAMGGLMTNPESAQENANNTAIANSIGVVFSAAAALAGYGIYRCVKRCTDGAEFKGLIGEPARSRRRK